MPQPGTDTIPPFNYRITFIYSDAVPVILEGRETNPILIIDVTPDLSKSLRRA